MVLLTYNDAPNILSPIKCFPSNNDPTRHYNDLLIMGASATQLRSDSFLLAILFGSIYLKVLKFIFHIRKVCTGLLGNCIIRMSHKCMLKALLELEPSLPPFPMNPLHLLMCRIRTHAATSCNWGITTNYRTNCVVVSIFWTVAMSIVLQQDLAVMNGTAWTTNSDSVNNDNPDLFFHQDRCVDTYHSSDEVQVALETEAQISSMKNVSKTIFLSTGMWHYKCL